MSPGPLIAWLPPPLPPAQPSSGPASEVGSRSRPALPPSSAEVSLTQSLEQFKEEDLRFIKAQQRRTTLLLLLIGIVVLLVAFILFRIISREIERRRRLRAEELLRKQQAEREQALWDAKESGMEVTMSVEERRRAELQENAIAMAKEHPEDVAMLIRTWLMEE